MRRLLDSSKDVEPFYISRDGARLDFYNFMKFELNSKR